MRHKSMSHHQEAFELIRLKKKYLQRNIITIFLERMKFRLDFKLQYSNLRNMKPAII